MFALFAAALCGCSLRAAPRVHPEWQLYSNSKYGYQIEYPAGYDLWETGLEGERDGASIRIGLHEYEAITPALDIKIVADNSASHYPPSGIQLPDLNVSTEELVLNGSPAKETEYRWKANGSLAFVDIEMKGVLFQFMAGPQTPDLHQTDWWAIIQTFRFTR